MLMGSHFPTMPALVGAAPTGAGSALPISWPLTGAGETIMTVEDQWKTMRLRASGTVAVGGAAIGGDDVSHDFDLTAETTVAGVDWGVLVPSSGPFVGGRDWNLFAETFWEISDPLFIGVTISAFIGGLYRKDDGAYAKGISIEAVGRIELGGAGEYFYRDTHTNLWLGGLSGFAGVDEPVGNWTVLGSAVPARRAQDWHVPGDPTFPYLTLSPVTLTIDVTARFATPAALG